MKYEYQPKGVCARKIYLDVEDGVVKEVAFEGGCDGNHKGLCALVKDMPCDAVKEKLSGIHCGFRQTSCPDQLAKAVEEAAKRFGKEKIAVSLNDFDALF